MLICGTAPYARLSKPPSIAPGQIQCSSLQDSPDSRRHKR